ncbi:MAG: tubulin-like doman-containing protein [Lachnospiraceae bacterium]|nr:tubulin-like doman-containing protein [Lachnospiraceae bacterium]
MGFDQDKKDKLKESMDYESQGHLTAIANKAATLDVPILIIGLGGTGVDAVIRLKKMIYDRLECGEDEQHNPMDKPKNIEYLVMDTDSSYKNINYHGIGFTESLKECLIYTSGSITPALQAPGLADYIKSWINPDLEAGEVINGAGANRQVGRYMFFDNISDIKEVLTAKIKNITADYSNKTPLYTFVLAGISGGTGSGTFIDVPYIVRQLSASIDNNRPVNRIGILFMPDVNLNRPAINLVKSENLKKNGFAALKELDYLMNIGSSGDCFEQSYGGKLHVGRNASGDIRPFEACVLLSAKDKLGRIDTNPYEYTLAVAAETVLGFISAEPGVEASQFSINSFLSNYENDRHTFIRLLGDNIRPVNYNFAVAGGSSAILPLDDIMSYMAYLAFDDLDEQWSRTPSEKDIDNLVAEFKISEKDIIQELSKNTPKISGLNRHTFDLIKQAPDRIGKEYDDNLKSKITVLSDNFNDLCKKMDERLNSGECPINEIFVDPDRGPIFAQKMIYTSSANPCLEKVLRDMKAVFLGKGPSSDNIEILQKAEEARMRELLASKPLLSSKKEDYKKNLIKALDELYAAKFDQELYKTAQALCEKYIDLFLKKNNTIYSCISEMLSTLIELFNKYGKISTKSDETKSGSVTTLNWSMIDVPQVVLNLKNKIESESDSDLHVDLHAFIKEFYKYLFENADIWNGSKKADIVRNINYFISKAFEKVLNKSMDYYIEFIANANGMTATAYSQKICKDLVKKSEIKYPVSATYNPTINNPNFSFVSVPKNAELMKNEIKQYLNEKSIIKSSEITDRLFMMQFEDCMPISSYNDIGDYYQSYSSLAGGEEHGLHLYETKELNWYKLPSPFPESEWNGTVYSNDEIKQNAGWRDLFDRAKAYNIIKVVSENGRDEYHCYWGRLIDADGVIKSNGLDLSDSDIDPKKANAVLKTLQDAMADTSRFTVDDKLFAAKNVKAPNGEMIPDEEFAKNIFIKMVTVRENVEKMVKDCEKCDEIIKKLEPFKSRESLITMYVKLFYTETVTKIRGEYRYVDRKDALQSFKRLEGKENNYPDYYLFTYFFKAYMGAERQKMEEIIQISEKIYNNLSSTDEGYDKMKQTLEAYVEALREIKSDLNSNWNHIPNGDKYLAVYTDILEDAEATLSGF